MLLLGVVVILGIQTLTPGLHWSPYYRVETTTFINEAVGARRPVHSYGSRAADTAAVFDSLWRKVRGLVRT